MSNLTKTLLGMELSRTLKGALSVAILTFGIITAKNLVVSLNDSKNPYNDCKTSGTVVAIDRTDANPQGKLSVSYHASNVRYPSDEILTLQKLAKKAAKYGSVFFGESPTFDTLRFVDDETGKEIIVFGEEYVFINNCKK